MSHLRPFSLFFAALLLSAASARAETFPKYNEVWRMATHNSYWIGRDNVTEIQASGTQERLIDQLLFENVRGLEIDVHKDNTHPKDWTVYHTNKQSNSTCSPLGECLKILKLFHHVLPEHEVVTVVLELKEITEFNFDANHTPRDLDALLLRVMGPELIYTPRDFLARCPPGAMLTECAKTAGWPTIDALRGKFIFTVLGNWQHTVSPTDIPLLGKILPNIRLGSIGHGSAGWVDYATRDGPTELVDIRARVGFPMQTDFPKLTGPDPNETIDPRLLSLARARSIFMQVENVSPGAPARPISPGNAPPVAQFLAANGVVRGHDSFEYADHLARIQAGFHLIQTDYPWARMNRDARSPFQPLPAVAGKYGVTAFYEPGHKLSFLATRNDPGAWFAYRRDESPSDVWETLPSTTRPDKTHANPRRDGKFDPQAQGCIRFATAGRGPSDANADAIRICRRKARGLATQTKPLDEDAIVTVETVLLGKHTKRVFYSPARSSDGLPQDPNEWRAGDLLQLELGGGGKCAIARSAGSIGPGGQPVWREHGRTCFPAPLVLRGITAEDGDVLFVGTKTSRGFVAAADLSTAILRGAEKPMSELAYALEDRSWPMVEKCPMADGRCVMPMHRAYNGQGHQYATTLVEATVFGYELDWKNNFYVESVARPGWLPLRHCYLAAENRHLYSVAADCERAVDYGPIGFVSPRPLPGLVALDRMYDAKHKNRVLATSAAERALLEKKWGFVRERTVGYVWPTAK
jgi:hypothetical protein